MLVAAARVIGDVLGVEPDWTTLLNTDHNHVQSERHGDRSLWVHRKGANVAADGKANVIPGSMATHSYHVEGRGEAAALASSSHGAGRRLSRSAARAKIRRKDLARQLANVWIDPHIAGRIVDEAPAAYKDIDAVMRAQRDLVRIVRRVRPVVCYKGV
jgi:tRNA-splicing ligase RtcB